VVFQGVPSDAVQGRDLVRPKKRRDGTGYELAIE
jgi:hypothetical protein